MMIRPADLLRPDKPVLFDGGAGTELLKRGLASGDAPELWNLEYPGHVLDMHRSFIEAGSRVITTNTFGANAIRLREIGADVSARDAIAAACGLAKEAAGGRALVAGSIGPLGALVEPHGPVSLREARAAFAEVVETFLTYGIDVLLIETMTSVDEAEIALRQALIAGSSVVAVSMSFGNTSNGPRTQFGESPSDAVRRLQEAGAHIVGSNCGDGAGSMSLVARELVDAATAPVIIRPNAGIPEVTAGGLEYPVSPDSFARFIGTMSDMGIRLLGGCCGVGPEHIRQARKVLG